MSKAPSPCSILCDNGLRPSIFYTGGSSLVCRFARSLFVLLKMTQLICYLFGIPFSDGLTLSGITQTDPRAAGKTTSREKPSFQSYGWS